VAKPGPKPRVTPSDETLPPSMAAEGMPSIIEAIDTVWQAWFRDRESWAPWFTFLRAVFGLPMDGVDRELFERHTGRTEILPRGFREVWVRVGRRSGKSLIAATIAVFLSVFRDWSDFAVPGESAVVLVLASDRRQARVIFRYAKALLQRVPALAPMVTRETEEIIELANGISLEIATNSFRRVRGYSVICCVCDEIAFWQSDESANPDKEVLTALRPAMGGRGLLYCLSSPHARSGALYEADVDNWGKNESKVMIWRATTREMHVSFPQEVVDEALARDPSAGAAEYLAEYRSDIEQFLTREVIDALIVPGRFELPPGRRNYSAWCDPSGGSGDSMTLAIAHAENNVAVIDLIREVRPPFSPDAVVAEFAEILKRHRIMSVTGDRYAGEWCRERFRACGVGYEVSERSTSDIYIEALPLLMARRVELLDHPRTAIQLQQLERRAGRAGKTTISHRLGGHDDCANAVCGAIVLAAGAPDWLDVWMRCVGSSKEELFRKTHGGAVVTPLPFVV
jgi:Terminase large subunit, ATPase domain